MASAQVLPSSRKQEHLEAGKRRLEEFRKKKAADRAKKAAATSQPLASDVSGDQKQPLEAEHVRITDSDGAGTSDGPGRPVESCNGFINNDSNITNRTTKAAKNFLEGAVAKPLSENDSTTSLADLLQRRTNNHDYKGYDASGFTGLGVNNYKGTEEMSNDSKMYAGRQGQVSYGKFSDQSITSHSQEGLGFDSSYSQYTPFQSTENNNFLKDYAFTSPQNSASQLKIKGNYPSTLATDVDFIQPSNNLRGSNLEVEQDMSGGNLHFNGSMNSDIGERKFSSLHSSFPSVHGRDVQTFESVSSSSDIRSSTNHVQQFPGTSEPNSRRSRPSFLDSLNVPRAPSALQSTEPQKQQSIPSTLNSDGMDDPGSSAFQKATAQNESVGEQLMKFSVSSSNGFDLMSQNVNENGLERKHELYSSKQNEDFAALEQHIEDLTQEKFSLQRALDASRALAESLAAENSSLTDNYNQQRIVVSQLKSEMEKLQEEIKALLVELDSVKMEYANAKLECNAADERGKILASEVIGLEEKALRLRSNELKLERQLENSHTEIASYKKKMSSLEKDRQDLQSTIDALQEEKKLLQSKLRKASASGKSIDVSKSHSNKRDMSTTTEDLDASPNTSNQEINAASLVGSDSPSFPMLPESSQSNLEVSSAYIPLDQMRMIENINTLISELAIEKEELIQALASESAQHSRLKLVTVPSSK
ncbi:protein BLISTER isoform X2 [Manihot esculenta]|uniref:protein BLISTER isoform X2 n=1 Tax=Manihot esculenta TaxID=3983 RepID=UPI000B5D26AF|nr:protein BLISTER isoform X2 [Manihot esculenta]